MLLQRVREQLDKEVASHRQSLELILSTRIVSRAFQGLKELSTLMIERRAAVSGVCKVQADFRVMLGVAMAHQVLLVWRQETSRSKLQVLLLQETMLKVAGKETHQQLDDVQIQYGTLFQDSVRESQMLKLKHMQASSSLLSKIFHLELAIAFQDFVHACDKSRITTREHTIKMRVVRRLCNRSLFAVLKTWFEHAKERKISFSKAQRVVRRMLNGTLAAGFQQWHAKSTEEGILRERVYKVLQRLMLAVRVMAFERWREHLRETKGLRIKTLRVIMRLVGNKSNGHVVSFSTTRLHVLTLVACHR